MLQEAHPDWPAPSRRFTEHATLRGPMGLAGIVDTVRFMAVGMDETEQRLEKLRVSAGFDEDWSPYHNRRERAGSGALIRWADKAGAMNGPGDLNALVGEMAEGLDLIDAKVAELMGGVSWASPQAAIPTQCPKCGKALSRGGHMHTKSCKG